MQEGSKCYYIRKQIGQSCMHMTVSCFRVNCLLSKIM